MRPKKFPPGRAWCSVSAHRTPQNNTSVTDSVNHRATWPCGGHISACVTRCFLLAPSGRGCCEVRHGFQRTLHHVIHLRVLLLPPGVFSSASSCVGPVASPSRLSMLILCEMVLRLCSVRDEIQREVLHISFRRRLRDALCQLICRVCLKLYILSVHPFLSVWSVTKIVVTLKIIYVAHRVVKY